MSDLFKIPLNTKTKLLFSTSGSNSSIQRHNTAIQKLGFNLCYFTFSGEISAQIYTDAIRAPFVNGGTVTAHNGLKSKVIPFLDYVEPLAKQTLAVNTIINKDGKLYGYNTDCYGLHTALTKGIKESKQDVKTAIIYGNGGVSGVAFKVLQDLGIKVTIVGRNADKVAQKRKELGIENIPHFEAPYDLVIDATPISSSPELEQNTQFIDLVKHAKIVFCHAMPEKDNKKNYLLEYCNQNGIFYISGEDMYIAQLIKQYKLYFENLDSQRKITEEDIIEAWGL
ncbi:shikimate dehydrogenase [Francisella tularensis subsp. novicida]|uniref:shikimate dehydrogenase family protein n=1 Tax=Francisella tularensis TaxID=263 RepID=UPI000158ADF6|nr:shikimate 5-dehydrogenase [Francisella tularensis]AJI44633.1 shikimate dehydrogenase substrate binding domain protein [Francisella tularensis subsp. novicida F6168]AJJ47830.1 shikimate dehydrogenase substrate binding domain protein [Francisella tularensis subsp. novicida]APC98839.1 shikimate dehydrogenase substrate binding domain protein [Francisella tularensis subsp. novicida]EDN35853.1 shikimate 5-dehydrogenase [Francisella tularensis subsp. novicida GA99-3549]KFJ67424.1 shikimate dehydro